MEDLENVPSVEPSDRRAAIEAAFAEAEAEPEVVEPVEVEAVAEEAAPVEVEAEPEVEAVPETTEVPVEVEAVEAPAQADKPVNIERAPQSWKPEARESWKDLPESAKREIARREREIATTLQQSADERRFASDIHNVFKPYEAELRAANISHKAALEDLLNTSYVLRRGTSEQRATLVKNIIDQHGVDLNVLNDLYVNAHAKPQADPNAQRLAQLEAAEQARQRQHQQHSEASINKEIDAFAADPKNEFFQDVAPMMSALLNNGQSSTLADAYEKAIWAHPEVRKVLTSRQTSTQSQASQTQSKLAAASSVKGSTPKVTAQPKKAFTDRRAALEAAFDQFSGNKRT